MDVQHRALNSRSGDPVLLRLQGGGPPDAGLAQRLVTLAQRTEVAPAKTVLQTQDDPVLRPRYLLSGWACRFRFLRDGRRQIFDLVLPGEGVGVCLRPTPIASTSCIALTPVILMDAEPLLRDEALQACPELLPALHRLAADDERRALNQIVRLGRQTALERMAHLLLELHQRLLVIGDVERDRYRMPLTQDTLADITGLSVVHVNRTLQELRRAGYVRLERGYAHLLDRPALEVLADWESPRPQG